MASLSNPYSARTERAAGALIQVVFSAERNSFVR